MQKNSENQRSRFFRIHEQITAMLLLWALLIAVFAPSFASAETTKALEGMVYCPLSRKFQPINSPAEKREFKPFQDICANDETKARLYDEIVIKNPFKPISLGENKLDELAFNFLTHGQSVLKDLPNLPNFPSENLVKQVGASVSANNNYEHKFSWIKPLQFASLTLLARPPTIQLTALFANDPVHQSDELSRRLAPRVPPVRS